MKLFLLLMAPEDLAVASSLTHLFLSCFGKLGMEVERLNPYC
jgi:hypothetical protein